MEIKKSYIADLENKRLTWFLLGLILSLAALFVAFEYTTKDDEDKDNQEALDDMDQDIENIPLIQQKNMIAAMAAAPKSAKSLTDKLKLVDEKMDIEKPDIINKGDNDDDNASAGNGEGQGASDANGKTTDETTALSPVATDLQDNPLNFQIVEELPDFPGGMVEFMKWLTRTLKYPVDAQNRKIQGKVIVQFIINKDGTVVDPKIVKTLDPSCDREALRVVRMMPRWKPGTEHKKTVRTKFVIPIIFKL